VSVLFGKTNIINTPVHVLCLYVVMDVHVVFEKCVPRVQILVYECYETFNLCKQLTEHFCVSTLSVVCTQRLGNCIGGVLHVADESPSCVQPS
jgi:hypothetical protein